MFVKFNGNSGGRLWNRRWYRALNYKRIYDGFNLIINRHIELRENEEKEKRKKGQKQIYIYVYRESRVKEMEGEKKKKGTRRKKEKNGSTGSFLGIDRPVRSSTSVVSLSLKSN